MQSGSSTSVGIWGVDPEKFEDLRNQLLTLMPPGIQIKPIDRVQDLIRRDGPDIRLVFAHDQELVEAALQFGNQRPGVLFVVTTPEFGIDAEIQGDLHRYQKRYKDDAHVFHGPFETMARAAISAILDLIKQREKRPHTQTKAAQPINRWVAYASAAESRR